MLNRLEELLIILSCVDYGEAIYTGIYGAARTETHKRQTTGGTYQITTTGMTSVRKNVTARYTYYQKYTFSGLLLAQAASTMIFSSTELFD